MNWKVKALVQGAISLLPVGSTRAYEWVQRRFGAYGSAQFDAINSFRRTLGIIAKMRNAGFEPEGKRLLEVGTGTRLYSPLTWWICGTREIHTFDVQVLLQAPIVQQEIDCVVQRTDELAAIFREFDVPASFEERLRWLASKAPTTIPELLGLIDGTYHAPADAAKTGLEAGSIDVHTSCNTLEHIPKAVLEAIFGEAFRLLSPAGLLIHKIDLSDHYAHHDPSITRLNYLQYGDLSWRILNHNRFMYQNRLRYCEYRQVLEGAGFHLHAEELTAEPEVEQKLREQGKIAPRFRRYSPEDNAVTGAYVLATTPKEVSGKHRKADGPLNAH